jgi:hypothetical protein
LHGAAVAKFGFDTVAPVEQVQLIRLEAVASHVDVSLVDCNEYG